jgi:hypothetical protein
LKRFIFNIPQLPEGKHAASLPINSGKILIQGSNGEQLSVSYFGLVSNVKQEIRTHKIFWHALDGPKIQTGPGLKEPWEKP